MSYAEVAVNSPGAQRRLFSYVVPPHVQVGHAVWVPFGPRIAQGLVMQLTERPSVEESKEIAGLIDPRPVLSPAQVELAYWISDYYLAPIFDAAALMMPPGFERRMLAFVSAAPDASPRDLSILTSQQRALLRLLQRKGRLPVAEVEKSLGRRAARAAIDQLVRRKLIARTFELEKVRVRPKVVAYVRLAIGSDEARREADRLYATRRAPKQARLLEFLAGAAGSVPASEAKRRADCTAAVLRALEEKGMVTTERVRAYRDPLSHRSFALPLIVPVLTRAQEAAWRPIETAMTRAASGDQATSEVFLLRGVTGSGKTEVYLRALEHAVSRGKRGIVLVPEIALTPQTIERFAARFPGRVAVLHSKLSVGEQFDEWWRIKQGAFDVVIGSRGAVFAPQPDLGLIVVDEEHEWSYKQQEQAPRYHARDVAIRLARLSGSVVILGSATPDVVSYCHSRTGEYDLLELPERIDTSGLQEGGRLPEVEVVDLREELKAGNRSIFSRSLVAGMKKALAAGEQVILFLNRRGGATFVQCRDCGHVLRCRRCDVALSYHSAEDELVCHHCNDRTRVPDVCPGCGSKRIKFLGTGTQKLMEETARVFPKARLLRWDRDVTGGRYSHEAILDKFVAHEADVLIGTQMIAKGLDLPQVTLVGVVNADISLHLPDFRAAERTFQLLSQVAGRAGRGRLAGRVIVQSYNPEHYAIIAASKHDYLAFYHYEIELRRQYDTPPFGRLVRLTYASPSTGAGQKEAERMQCRLKEERDSWGMDVSVIGPAPAFIQRVRGRYRWQIILRGNGPVRLLAQVPIPQGWMVDVDPISLL